MGLTRSMMLVLPLCLAANSAAAQRQAAPLLSSNRAHLQLQPNHTQSRIRIDSTVSAPRASRTKRGAKYGAVIGAVVGGLGSIALYDQVGCDVGGGSCSSAGGKAGLSLYFTGVGALLGAGVGAVAGSMLHSTAADASPKNPR
jgi:hypothetical protein